MRSWRYICAALLASISLRYDCQHGAIKACHWFVWSTCGYTFRRHKQDLVIVLYPMAATSTDAVLHGATPILAPGQRGIAVAAPGGADCLREIVQSPRVAAAAGHGEPGAVRGAADAAAPRPGQRGHGHHQRAQVLRAQGQRPGQRRVLRQDHVQAGGCAASHTSDRVHTLQSADAPGPHVITCALRALHFALRCALRCALHSSRTLLCTSCSHPPGCTLPSARTGCQDVAWHGAGNALFACYCLAMCTYVLEVWQRDARNRQRGHWASAQPDHEQRVGAGCAAISRWF